MKLPAYDPPRLSAEGATRALATLASPEIASHSARFFQAYLGGYGEGDRFRGIRVPLVRAVARRFRRMELGELRRLLRSPFHEDRLCSLAIMSTRFPRVEVEERSALFQLYWDELDQVNNWDLVDLSAPALVGGFLADRNRNLLRELALAPSLWRRRIAIMATFFFIRKGDYEDAFSLIDMLLADPEDLIHKASGWMLREIGNRDGAAERRFLASRYQAMPRVMLRYAIEKFPEEERLRYLRGQA